QDRRGAQPSRDHGARDDSLLRARHQSGYGCGHPQAARRPGGDRTQASFTGRGVAGEHCSRSKNVGRRSPAAFICFADWQPGLAGLMDGSVSTLAPVFAAAFATKSSHDAFVVGLAASIGAGISMAFAEALSDDGSLTGRGRPVLGGAVTGLMTAFGGVGHTLPFLISDFHVAFVAAVIVVALELAAIAWIRNKYMDTPLLSAAFQVVVGGVLVFVTGIWIGSS